MMSQITKPSAITERPRNRSFSISAGAGVKYSAFNSAYSKTASTNHKIEASQNIQQAAYDEMNATLQVESFADGFSLGLRFGIESYGRETAYGRDGDK